MQIVGWLCVPWGPTAALNSNGHLQSVYTVAVGLGVTSHSSPVWTVFAFPLQQGYQLEFEGVSLTDDTLVLRV